MREISYMNCRLSLTRHLQGLMRHFPRRLAFNKRSRSVRSAVGLAQGPQVAAIASVGRA